jgi:hypothetical protein
MTEQKKEAIEIFNEFSNVEYLEDWDGMDDELAKECATIAVNRIIKSIQKLPITDKQIEYIKHYIQVNEEIQKL